MPDARCHRGPHPDDWRLFAQDQLPALRQAMHDFCWLLNRGYAGVSALKLVGDRYRLEARQRLAIQRSACTDEQLAIRTRRCIKIEQLARQALWIDGFNLLTTIEAALAGGVILAGHDGCFRDLASVHGTYRKVEETRPALELIGHWLAAHKITAAHWLLDSPVSNSGRLKQIIEAVAAESGWPWAAEVVRSPDQILGSTQELITTADSAILDRCKRWCGVAAEVVRSAIPDAWIIDLNRAECDSSN